MKLNGSALNKVNENVVSTIEDLLCKAKVGEIHSIIYITERENKFYSRGFALKSTFVLEDIVGNLRLLVSDIENLSNE